MLELKEHKAYEMLNTIFHECLLDYIILLSDEEYHEKATHKKAIIEAFRILNTRHRVANNFHFHVDVQEQKMTASKCEVYDFLQLPKDNYYQTKPEGNRYIHIPTPIPYWFAFLDPPYHVPYVTSDFEKLNHVLFPFPKSLDIYKWEDNFSNYFDDGKEWWGTGCWSVYDKVTKIFVVIGASLSD